MSINYQRQKARDITIQALPWDRGRPARKRFTRGWISSKLYSRCARVLRAGRPRSQQILDLVRRFNQLFQFHFRPAAVETFFGQSGGINKGFGLSTY